MHSNRNFISLTTVILLLSCALCFDDFHIRGSPFLFKFKILENIINIAYCTTNNNLKNVGYSLISIINRTNERLHVYLYTPSLFDKINTIFDKLEIETKGQVKFFMDTINFTLCKETFRNRWNFWNPFAYARIFMIEKIPVSRCIYLDTDVYGCDDINKLWRIHLGNNLIAATYDKLPWRANAGKEHMAILNSLMDPKEIALMNGTGLTTNNYFNSGVLLMNIEEMRKVNFTQRCVESYRKNQTFFPDQDLLNMFAGHRRIVLSWEFNKPVYGNYAKCILRHYNQKKVTHPVVIRHHEDYDYHFDAVDEYYKLMAKSNRTVNNILDKNDEEGKKKRLK